ncbi:MAG: prepilin-type N-terminal cleavage/methylation domain-containing protein [Planctomycetes bacterium]|nr:prepilin-type N-terminal cleavage/methylation domain-containing protein [Planctomycetota bacterium]
MDLNRRQFGLTLTEVLVALVVLLILMSTALRMGQYVRTRSAIQLTESLLGVIDTALQLYYEEYRAFPPAVPEVSEAGFEAATGTSIAVDQGTVVNEYWPSAALYFILNRVPVTREILSAVSKNLVTAKDIADQPIIVVLADRNERVMLLRFVDAWGKSLWYEYAEDDAYPRVISAGPDNTFGTEDDIENK